MRRTVIVATITTVASVMIVMTVLPGRPLPFVWVMAIRPILPGLPDGPYWRVSLKMSMSSTMGMARVSRVVTISRHMWASANGMAQSLQSLHSAGLQDSRYNPTLPRSQDSPHRAYNGIMCRDRHNPTQSLTGLPHALAIVRIITITTISTTLTIHTII